ncbi:unnamed protein product [Musa banksii]
MCKLTPSLVAHCSCLLLSSPFHFNSILASMDRWLGRGKTSLVCLLLVGLLSHNVFTPVVSRSLQEFAEQKNYYPPATGSTPTHSHGTPNCPTPSGGGYGTPTPSHGGSHGIPTVPSHGGSHGTTPTVPSHGGSYGSTPTVPSQGSPTPSGGYSPPYSPSTPSTPTTDPHIPPFFTGTCRFWGSHPDAIAAIIGSLGTIGDLFGHGCAAIFGSNPSLTDALTNTRTDGYGALIREGTAAFLNSMANSRYPFTTRQVKTAFAGAITSDGIAATQAEIFEQANEGKYKT